VEEALSAVLGEKLTADDIKLDVAEALLTLGTASGRAWAAGLVLGDAEARAELAAMLEEFDE
jgi:hypothetical protein